MSVLIDYPTDDGSRAYAAIMQAIKEKNNDGEVKAIALCDEAIADAQYAAAPLLEAWALCVKATSAASIGMHKDGFQCATKALAIAQLAEDKCLEARAFFAISFVALESHDEVQAQIMLERAVDCAEAAQSGFDLFWALNNLSHIYGERAEGLSPSDEVAFSAALDLLFQTARRALQVAEHRLSWREKCFAFLNLANAHLINKDFQQARRLITTYAALAKVNASTRLMAYANLDKARLLAAEERVSEAIHLLDDPLHFVGLCKTDDLRLRTHETLVRLHKTVRNFEAALAHLEAARTLERKVQAMQTTRHIHAISAKLTVEEARAEASRLQAETASLALRNQLLERDQEELRRNAMLDALTGLGNRRAADTAIDLQLEIAQRSGQVFQVSYVDVDHFKQVNDRFGHPIGDEVLVALGQILRSKIRSEDGVFRYGGEEFILLQTDQNPRALRNICERIRHCIVAYDWTGIAPELRITASFGVAAWTGETDRKSLLARADVALYRAKEAGRNQVMLN